MRTSLSGERWDMYSGNRTGNEERKEMPLGTYVWFARRGNAQVVRRSRSYRQARQSFSERRAKSLAKARQCHRVGDKVEETLMTDVHKP